MKPPIYLTFGVNEAPFLGEGWYGRERFHGGITARQTARRATLSVDLNNAAEIALTFTGHTETLGRPLRGQLFAGERKLNDLIITNNAWKMTRTQLPEPVEGDTLIIQTVDPWCPDEYFRNGDGRIVGLVISALRITYTK